MTSTEVATPTIHDFTVTVDTAESGGDKLVVHLDRAGAQRLTMACSATQLLWVIDDRDYFANGFKFTVFRRVAELREQGQGFEAIAAALGVDAGWARQVYDEAMAAVAAQAGA